MSSSNRYNLFTHADNASREHSPEDSDYPRQPLGDELEIDWSPPQSPEPAASEPTDPAPAGTGSADVQMTETRGQTTTVGPSSAATTPDLSMQGMGESLPAVSNKRDLWDSFHKTGREAVEFVEASKKRKIREAQSSTSVGTTIPSAPQDLHLKSEMLFNPHSIHNSQWTSYALIYSTAEDQTNPIGNIYGFLEKGVR